MYKGRCRVFSTPTTVRSLLRKFAVFLAGIGLLLLISFTPKPTKKNNPKRKNKNGKNQRRHNYTIYL